MSLSEHFATALDKTLGSAQHFCYLFISRSFSAEKTPIEIVRILLERLAGLNLLPASQDVTDEEFWNAFSRHPDLLRADSERSILRKEDVELFRERTLYPPTFARRRLLLIERAERLNTQSANSLLKTFEEPLAACVFVLTTAHPNQLPSTILSRCHKITLPAWNDEQTHALDLLDSDDAAYLKDIFTATHLTSPPTIIPSETLFSSQKIVVSPKTLSALAQWCDAAGRKYTGQILRDAVVEITSAQIKSGRLSQSRATLLRSEISAWADMEPFNPTTSFWLMRILLTLTN